MIDNGEKFFRAFSPVSSLLRKIERRQKQKSQVMQPVTKAALIVVVILFELPCFSGRINSSSRSAIHRNPVSLSVAETTGNTDEHLTSNFVNIPVFEDVYTIGLYYVQIKIGDSSKHYNLHIDTGSNLTWLSKERYPLYESQSIHYVRCDEPRCIDVHRGKCKKNADPCDYKIRYQDEASSEGRLVTDSFTLHLKDGSSISRTLAIGRSTYYSSKEPNGQSITDGMLGLGKGRISIISQLHEQGNFANIFGHCLSNNSEDYGFMFIGKDFDYPRCLTWVPMSNDISHYYSLTMAEVVYGDEQLLGWNQDFVFDSGATDTYFVDPLYQQLLTKIAEMPLQKVSGDDACWEDTTPFRSILHLRNRFSSLYLKSGNGQALEIPPENYLNIMKDGDACLAILNGSAHGLNNFNLIGATSMQNVMVVYDNEQQKIGWAPVTGCTQPLNCPTYTEHIGTLHNYGNFANKKFHNHLLLLVLLLLETINEILLV